MGITTASGAGETSFFLLQYARSKKSLALIALSFVALMLIPDKGWSQQGGQSGWRQQVGQSGAHRLYARARENPAITATPRSAAAMASADGSLVANSPVPSTLVTGHSDR